MSNKPKIIIYEEQALTVSTTITLSSHAVEGTPVAKDLFVHHVFFWLKNPDSEADKAKLIEGLETLTQISNIKMAHIGTPADTHRDVIERGYAISWLLLFDSPEEEEIYQNHPVHHKFVEDYAHLWTKVIVYDSVG